MELCIKPIIKQDDEKSMDTRQSVNIEQLLLSDVLKHFAQSLT